MSRNRKNISSIDLTTDILEDMISIVDSKDNDYLKAEKLYYLFPTVESLQKAYPSFVRFLPFYEGEEKAKIYIDQYAKVKSIYLDYIERGIFQKISEIVDNDSYYQTYKYSKFIVQSFIRWNDSFDAFYKYFGINEEIFEFCLSVVDELDVDLYKYYHYKINKDKKDVKENYKEIIKDLAFGINNGTLKDGTKFDFLEFLKRVPFILDKEDFIHNLTVFMKKNNKDEMSIILKYIKENNMYNPRFFYDISVPAIYQTKIIINGRELTDADKDFIVNYIKDNNMPFITKTYMLVREKYLNGELKNNKVKKNKKENYKKRVLIP